MEDLIIAGKNPADTQAVYLANRDGSGLKQIVDAKTSAPVWAPHADELIYEKLDPDDRQLFKIVLDGGLPRRLTRRGENFDADWFDPAFALPVSPHPHLLTTVWGEIKIRD